MSSLLEKPWDRDDATKLRRAAEIQRIRSIVEGQSAVQKEEATAAKVAAEDEQLRKAKVAAEDEQLRMLADMGFPYERCVDALRHYGDVGLATNWLLEHSIPGSSSGAAPSTTSVTGQPPPTRVSAQLQSLLSMGFPHELCVRALRENNGDVDRAADQLLALQIDSTRPPQAARELQERGRLGFDPQRQRLCSLNAMETAGGGNCLFHALLGALADFSQRQRPGHAFPCGPLPFSHEGMRSAVVGFASRNRNQCSLFYDNLNEVKLTDSIDADSRSLRGNDSIVGGGRFRSVEEYFQARRCFALLLNPSSHSCFSDHV